MKRLVAVQLYMVRDYLKNEQQIADTLKKIHDIGYDGVELCGFLMKDAGYWKRAMHNAGLKTVGIHEIFEDIRDNPSAVAQKARFFETEYLVAAAAMKVEFSNEQQVLSLAQELNNSGKYLKEEGITLLYHNHNCEFMRTESGQIAMDILFENTDPIYVKFELDTFWMSNAGVEVSRWVEKAGSRVPLIHINDCGVSEMGRGNPIRTPVGKELGCGNMDLPLLIKMAMESGCHCEILETHDNWINNSPFDSMAISRDYLRKYFR